MPRSSRRAPFPNLNSQNHHITSPPAKRYNCIAWAAGHNNRWWWPSGPGFWPPGVPREETLSAFLAAFETLGYEECEDGALEAGYEKVALFALRKDGDIKPTHAAKQLASGWWTSKLGPQEDIVHREAEDVAGPEYGTPVRFMRRSRSTQTKT